MKTVRLLLLLVAGAIVFLVATILRRESERTPESVLSHARSLVPLEAGLEKPNFHGALLAIEQGLISLSDEREPAELAPLAVERMRIFRARWDRSMHDRKITHEPDDLRKVLVGAQEFIELYGPDDEQVMLLGIGAALDMERFEEARLLAQTLLESAGEEKASALAQRSLGIVNVALADQKLEAMVRSQGEMTQEEFLGRLERAQRVALLHASNPAEQSLLNSYRSSLSTEDVKLAVRSVGAASGDYGRGVQHFLQAIELYPDEASVLGLQSLSLRARAYNDVIDLGMLALSRQGLSTSTAILSLTLRALQATSREAEARTLLRKRMRLNSSVAMDYGLLSNAELDQLCLVMLELGEHRALSKAAAELQNRSPDIDASIDYSRFGYFYTLLTRVALKNTRNIQPIIKKAEPRSESYEGQLMEYWAAVATVSDLAGRESECARFLLKAAKVAPLDPVDTRMREVTGRMWLLLAEKQLGLDNAAEAEDPLAHALRFLKGQRETLDESYAQAGEAGMQVRGRSSRSLRRRPTLRDAEGLYPEMGPFEACYRARLCLGKNQAPQLDLLLAPVLNKFPGLPMALELLAQGELDKNKPDRAIEYLLEIEERGLASAKSEALLKSIAVPKISGQQLRRLLQAGPGESALMALLLRVQSLGEQERLLDLLTEKFQNDLPLGALELGVHVQLDRGDTGAALKLYERMDKAELGQNAPAGAGLRLVAALLSKRTTTQKADQLMRQLLAAEAWQVSSLERGIDALLADGHIDLARESLRKANTGALSLGPELLLRWAWSGALAGDAPGDHEALEALSRAEPYLPSGQAEFVRLLMAVDSGDGPALQLTARRLLNSEFSTNELQRALLFLLAGNLDLALASVERHEDAQGDHVSAQDSLVRKVIRAASPGAQFSGQPEDWIKGPDSTWYVDPPGLACALLLAAESRPFAAWALARRRGLTKAKQQSPLYAVVRARAWRQLGNLQRAENALVAHTLPKSRQPEAWRLRERLAREILDQLPVAHRARAKEHLEDLQRLRLATQGPMGESVAQVTLIRARAMRSEGRSDEAATFIQNIREIWPEDPDLLLEEARIASAAGDLRRSFELYSELFDRNSSRAQRALPEVLELLDQQVAAGQLSYDAHRSRLDSLHAILPAQPALPLALAKLQMARTSDGSAWNSERAIEQLNRFRFQNKGSALESLAPGSAEAWVRFLSPINLELASELANQELNAHPERVELWRLWLELLVQSGRLGLAREIHESIGATFSDEALERNHGLLLLDTAQSLPVALKRTLKSLAKQDPRVELRMALGTLSGRGTEQAKADARATCLRLWKERQALGLDASQTVRLLLRSMGPEEQALGSMFEEAQLEASQPHARAMLKAFAHLHAFPAQIAASPEGARQTPDEKQD